MSNTEQEANQSGSSSKPNIFAEKDRRHNEYVTHYGLDDLEVLQQSQVILEARTIISREQITDEAEKRKVYDEVKRQCLEHSETSKSFSETIHEAKDDATGFEKGYKAFWREMKDLEEFEASQYHQGYKAAEQEYLAREGTKQVAIECIEGDSTDPIREELQQLREGVKELDERLKALERYTKE